MLYKFEFDLKATEATKKKHLFGEDTENYILSRW